MKNITQNWESPAPGPDAAGYAGDHAARGRQAVARRSRQEEGLTPGALTRSEHPADGQPDRVAVACPRREPAGDIVLDAHRVADRRRDLDVLAVTPLGTVVESRADSGHSNQVRSSLAQASIDGGLSSPLIGYGGTRETVGSDESIAIGATPECPRCGNRTIGSTGHAWNVLYSHGFVGLTAFVGFFVAILWRFRRDVSPIGVAGHTIVLVQMLYIFVYVGISSTLSLLMISVALLWRNERDREAGHPDPPVPALTDSGFRRLTPQWGRP